MRFLYNFPYSTTKALDRRTILRASTTSSGSFLLTIYAKYGCIQVTSTIMKSSGSAVLSIAALLALEPVVVCWLGFPLLKRFLPKKTPSVTGRH
jgi:hypothetical protein